MKISPAIRFALVFVVKRPAEKNPQSLTVMALTFEQRVSTINAREEGRKGGDAVLFKWK